MASSSDDEADSKIVGQILPAVALGLANLGIETSAVPALMPPSELLLIALELMLIARVRRNEDLIRSPGSPSSSDRLHDLALQLQRISETLLKAKP